MEARYTLRQHPLLAECQVAPEIFEQVLPRLDTLMTPFVTIFQGQVAEPHAKTSVCGRLANLARKNVAAMAYRVGHSRLPWPAVIGWDAWDDEPWRAAWRSQVKRHVGQGDGVLVCEPSGFATSGHESGGVARQWWGRRGQVDHWPGALSLGYVSSKGHTLVDPRLCRPQAWPQEKARLDQAGGPNASRASRTRHPLALEWLTTNGAGLPQSGSAGDDARGRPDGLRRRLAAWGERYLWAGPSHTARRALAPEPPAESGRRRPGQRPWHSVEPWSQARRAEAWPRSDGRAGRKGPWVVEAVQRRVVSSTQRRQPGEEETWVGIRDRDRAQQQGVQGDSSLAHAVPEAPRWACARVAKAAQRMEACLQSSKSDAGLADSEVRHWRGWQQPRTLALRATWFLVRATARGKTMDACDHLPADSPRHRHELARGIAMWHAAAQAQGVPEAMATP